MLGQVLAALLLIQLPANMAVRQAGRQNRTEVLSINIHDFCCWFYSVSRALWLGKLRQQLGYLHPMEENVFCASKPAYS